MHDVLVRTRERSRRGEGLDSLADSRTLGEIGQISDVGEVCRREGDARGEPCRERDDVPHQPEARE